MFLTVCLLSWGGKGWDARAGFAKETKKKKRVRGGEGENRGIKGLSGGKSSRGRSKVKQYNRRKLQKVAYKILMK